MSRRRRLLLVLAAFVLALALALGWLLGTTSGLRFALQRASHATGGALSVQGSSGTLAGPLTLDGLRFRVAGKVDVRAARVTLDPGLWALLRGHVRIMRLRVHGLDIDLPARTTSPASHASFDPRAPLHLVFGHVRVDGLRVHRGTTRLFEAERVDLAGAWTRHRLVLDPLRVHAPQGSVALSARVGFKAGYPGHAAARFDWRAGQRRWAGTLDAGSNGRRVTATLALAHPGSARAELSLSPRAPYAWQARLTLPRGAGAPWLGRGTGVAQLAVALKAHGEQHQLHATGSFDLGATRVQLAALDARLQDGGKRVQLDRLQLRSPQHPGNLAASGHIDLASSLPTAQLQVTWNGVTWPASPAHPALASQGQLGLDGSTRRYTATLDAKAGPPGKPSRILASVVGTPGRLQLDRLLVRQAKGRLDAHGELRYGTGWAWQLAASAKRFDPGAWLNGWRGALDARLASSGTLGKHGHAQLDLKSLSGLLRGRRVAGHGSLALSPARVLSGRMDLRYGNGHVVLAGARGASNRLAMDLRVNALQDWIEPARGAIDAHLEAHGHWPQLAVRGRLDGRRLAWHGAQASRLTARFDIGNLRRPGGSLTLTASKLHAAGFGFNALKLDAHGNAQSHSLTLDARGDPLSVRLALDGARKGSAWKGQLQRLDLRLAGQSDWRLQAPVALAWDQGAGTLGQACLSAGQPRVCLAAKRQRNGQLQASYRMHQLPLEMVLALAGNDLPMRAQGTLDGTGDLQRSASGVLTGQASLQSAQGKVLYVDEPQQPLLQYHQLDARADLSPGARTLRVTAGLQQSGSLDARAQLQGPRQTLDGRVRVRLDNLRFVELFTTEVAHLKGHLDADLTLAGTLGKPSLHGAVTADGLAGEIPALGLKLGQGRLRVSGDQASALRVEGAIHSGKGTLTIAGTAGMGAERATDLTLRGKQVQVADIPSATVSLSPDIRVRASTKGLQIDGKVHVDRAKVDLEKLPGGGVTQASPDVVVVDAGKPAARAATLPVSTDMQVELGDHAHVTGYGLDGNLHGGLRVTTRQGQPATGQGQIGIDGTFSAYGQDLSITRGQLLFASSPLDNPGLNIRAVRKLNPNATISDGQEVGLDVRGTARRPQLTVFSNPAMDPSDALAYLITGKPLSQVKGGEGNMVNSAAQALGSVTGDLLAKSIGSRLGISDIGVSSNEALGITAFTVGKYLSPRLYLSYGVGLFQPGQVVTLRYILSRRWNFEAQQSTQASRASLNYRYEH